MEINWNSFHVSTALCVQLTLIIKSILHFAKGKEEFQELEPPWPRMGYRWNRLDLRNTLGPEQIRISGFRIRKIRKKRKN